MSFMRSIATRYRISAPSVRTLSWSSLMGIVKVSNVSRSMIWISLLASSMEMTCPFLLSMMGTWTFALTGALRDYYEIGRASCRERV